jgi:hypothetical protein
MHLLLGRYAYKSYKMLARRFDEKTALGDLGIGKRILLKWTKIKSTL